jgi:hypothetical protein
MVRDTGFEPVTPSVSRKCSTTELTAHKRAVTVQSRPAVGKRGIGSFWPKQRAAVAAGRAALPRSPILPSRRSARDENACALAGTGRRWQYAQFWKRVCNSLVTQVTNGNMGRRGRGCLKTRISSSSPRDAGAGRGLRRGEFRTKNAPPLPGPLLHCMEERETNRAPARF